MALEFSTAGTIVRYCVETSAGTRPTTGYTVIPNIKSTPEFNPEPSNLEVTDLSDTEWKRYIPGLKDPGGALSYTANNTTAFQAAWDTFVNAAETAKASGLNTWIEEYNPAMEDSFYYAGMPSPLGKAGAEVDAVSEIVGYIVPNVIAGWAEASTNA